MGLFNRNSRKGNFADEIRCDESSYLIWKWNPLGTHQGANNRENAIRWGSSLRIKDGEAAVFVCNHMGEMVYDVIEGPYDTILETANLPVLSDIIGRFYSGGTPFPAEVYFINLAQMIQVKFGVPFFDVYDPRFADFSVPVAVRGTLSFRISDCRDFIKLHRLSSFSLEDFQKQIRDTVSRYVKDIVANTPAAHNISVIQIESRIAQINDAVEFDIGERLREGFGVVVSGVDIGAIEIDKSSNGYAQLMAVTQQVTSATVQAQATANIKDIQDKQRIEAENYEETLRIQREEAQYAQRKQTQSANFAAFQVEMQAEVGVAGAEALGRMGENGVAGGSGFNPAAMMAGMAVGGAIGQNIAGAVNNMMGGINQQAVPGAVPPPVPTVVYHVAVNGQATGPFDLATLGQMAADGRLTFNSVVWKPGMAEWAKAETIDELNPILSEIPPTIPIE